MSVLEGGALQGSGGRGVGVIGREEEGCGWGTGGGKR